MSLRIRPCLSILGLAVSFVSTACGSVESVQSDQEVQMERVSSDSHFQAMRDQLARHGDKLDMNRISFSQDQDRFAAIVPLAGETSEYEALVYQKIGDEQSVVTMMLSGRSPADTEVTQLDCYGWSAWYNLGYYCPSQYNCWWAAGKTYKQERSRTCYVGGRAYKETEHRDVFNNCGC